jgi:preprotein translocase subunit SecE
MAQETKDKEREVEEEDQDESSEGSSETVGGADDALARTDSSEDASIGAAGAGGEGEAGEGEGEGEEEQAATQLGADRYVLAGFFAAGMLGAYVVGRALQSVWVAVANKFWVSQNLPWLTAVHDDDKPTYTIVLSGFIALFVVFRTYRRPDVRAWTDEVAAELAKVVWPSRKDVTNSTFIVIVASTVATVYLALLDRLWAFVTNIVYGDGS